MVDEPAVMALNTADEMHDRKRRLLNQRAFPLCFVRVLMRARLSWCCTYTGLVSRGQAEQMGDKAVPVGPTSF